MDIFKDHEYIFDCVDIVNPNFHEAEKVHDWRNYVPALWVLNWNTLSERERKIIAIMAYEIAEHEEWD